MFAKPLADMEAQPLAAKRGGSAAGLMASPVSLRNIIDKNASGRPVIRWRRIRPALKEAGRGVLRKGGGSSSSSSGMTASASSLLSASSMMEKKMAATSKSLGASNPLRFLQETCPEDVLPLILAFAGPQKAAALQRTNRHWKNIMDEETTWKVMCKELYKVREEYFT